MIALRRGPKIDGGVYIARDVRRLPPVVVLVSLKAETEHHGLVAAYHDITNDEQLICCTPAEFSRWYRKRRQFLWWKEPLDQFGVEDEALARARREP